eukprot:11164553-Lingulodinium_polyedra.AAC.1
MAAKDILSVRFQRAAGAVVPDGWGCCPLSSCTSMSSSVSTSKITSKVTSTSTSMNTGMIQISVVR